MKLIFFISILLYSIVIIQGNLNFKNLDKEELARIQEECSKEFNITENLDVTETNKLQEVNDTSAEPHNVQCFLHCVVNKSFPDFLYENGSFKIDKFELDSKVKENQNLIQCLSMEGSDTCETTFKQFMCTMTILLELILEQFLNSIRQSLGIELNTNDLT
uniref:CSON004302 protein n=1 Tax=Culicoides sonorensis TaxID=179676 RepID=A0A336MPM5_CULSO